MGLNTKECFLASVNDAGKTKCFKGNNIRLEVYEMNIREITQDDSMWEFPEVYNANMKEIEKAIVAIMFEIARMKDDIAHLKIMIRED